MSTLRPDAPPARRPHTAAEVRQAFLDFFVRKCGHTDVPSSPVVPHDDPTLLFTNAGMNQFKDVFLGRGKRPYTRAVNTQKCIRAGGKHNDLEDVGRDTYHHTFFEMLGNWSFGDYFKEQSIGWGWEFLTGVLGLDPSRLYATYFQGNPELGLAPDDEARRIWLKFLPDDHVIPGSMKDNFWEMGETGPCGPCSEIHYDRIGGRNARKLVNSGDPDVLEIWNHVFIQFNRESDGSLKPLPAKHVDTGMGLERLVSVLQDKRSNYDTDLWTPIFEIIASRSGARPYAGKLEDPFDVAYRVIADHVRCLTVAIADGATPSNEGRGYVLRRILRRAVRHGSQTLGIRGPFLRDLVDVTVDTLAPAFPGLRANLAKVKATVEEEENAFLRTLDKGLALFEEAERRVRKAGGTTIGAEDAFRLHDTSGFPIDLTQVMAAERGLSVDVAGYEALMEKARETSRRAGGAEGGLELPPDALAQLETQGVHPTDDSAKFAGKPLNATVQAIWNGRNFDLHAEVGHPVAVICAKTSFYAEMGGQVGDRGSLRVEHGGMLTTFEVTDTRRIGGFVLHVGRVTAGKLNVGDTASLSVERERRERIRAHHTATHLLNLALREVCGPDEEQKGSLVDDEKLRFDFAHPRPLSPAELERVESIVNAAIAEDLAVDASEVPLATAKAIRGLRAIFGERYPDPVRVVAIGAPVAALAQDPGGDAATRRSVELCGGTHLSRTGEAKRFTIVAEGGLAAGVRRMTAVAGVAALATEAAAAAFASRISEIARLPDAAFLAEFGDLGRSLESMTIGVAARHRLEASLEPLRERAKALRRQAEGATRDAVAAQARSVLASHPGGPLVAVLENADPPSLLVALDIARATRGELPVLFLSPDEANGKVAIAAGCPQDAIAKGLKAGDWVKVAAQACGGSGGGKPDLAQAGGKDPGRLLDAVRAAREWATARS
jgi:alanyl-tRNA synthetase